MQGAVLKNGKAFRNVNPLAKGERAFFVPAPSFRPCWVEVDLEALRHNFRALRRRVSAGTGILAVVKANGYGHGLVPVSRVAVRNGAAYLGVSSLEEGIELRQAGITAPVLILGSLYPFDHFPVLFEKKLTPTLASPAAADALDRLARRRRQRLPVHLKIDSGFGRIGVSIPSALNFIERVSRSPSLRLEGLYTHFSCSDTDPGYTAGQAEAFKTVVQAAAARGLHPRWIHMANSAALIRYPESHGTLVRPGLAYYGGLPYAGAEKKVRLKPALSWKTRVVFLKTVPKGFSISYGRTWIAPRPTRIATLAVGYADGYPRLLSNQGEVLIRGRRVPVRGRVTMDMIMVDVTGLSRCQIGDEAVLLGAQGTVRLPVEELARKTQTNAYEILCRIGARVPRVYLQGARTI